MYLTRAVLNKDAGIGSIAPLLDPDDMNQALDAHHRLMWTLFPDKDAARDFLWRSDGNSRFYILSHRKPIQSDLFLPLESDVFDPKLTKRDRLSFALRANATRTRRVKTDRDGEYRSLRVDIVMDALHSIPGQKTLGAEILSERPGIRMQIADRVASEWLSSVGNRVGFSLEKCRVDNYSVRQVRRSTGSKVTLGLLDIRGVLVVENPDNFVSALAKGFGRAKAFGCGLMLIRRA